MRLGDLAPPAGAKKNTKRLGRGSGSGQGMTAGKGTKGQKSRSGGGTPPWFEGGQMPLQRRVPKRGFTNVFKKQFSVVNISDLARVLAGDEIGPAELVAAGILRKSHHPVKLLADGEITQPLTIRVHKASASAVQKIEAAGGKVEMITTREGK
ncbi:MAG: 50S ribosomal protein L15 [Syntrophobacteraceae bacterium]|nr:50S ribosomal protein L15 [Syntrophobacteraceae bacterium]